MVANMWQIPLPLGILYAILTFDFLHGALQGGGLDLLYIVLVCKFVSEGIISKILYCFGKVFGVIRV